MKLTKAGEYGIRCVLYLSKNPQGSILEKIAKEQDSPKFLTAKVLQRLAQCNIVKSMRGTGGGYVLARPPSEISMLDVIECIEGEICLNFCMKENECGKEDVCPVHPAWKEIQGKFRDMLDAYKFSMFAD